MTDLEALANHYATAASTFTPLTPHPSSGTQFLPSSPSVQRLHKRTPPALPSRQIVCPPVDGSWLKIGRSSLSSDVALPPSNRWASRVHASLRRILQDPEQEQEQDVKRDTTSVEVKCHGYNGLTLHLGHQTIPVKRDNSVIVHIHANVSVGIEITGSLVHIETARDAADDSRESSPVQEDDAVLAALKGVAPRSPPKSKHGLASPRSSPRSHTKQDSSPLGERFHNAQPPSRPSPLDLTKFSRASSPGKENIDPKSSRPHTRPTTPRRLSSSPRSPSLPTVLEEDEECVPSVSLPESVASPAAAKEEQTEEITIEAPFAVAAPEQPVVSEEPPSPVEETAPVSKDQKPAPKTVIDEAQVATPTKPARIACPEIIQPVDDLPADTALESDLSLEPETAAENEQDGFTDAILTALASSTLSPTPLSYLAPFFPSETSSESIEAFLRAQPAVGEVTRSGKDASGAALRSQWYYAPDLDGDRQRAPRLKALMKPIRSTRKQHKQYYWKPIPPAKRLDPSGLVDRKSSKRSKANTP